MSVALPRGDRENRPAGTMRRPGYAPVTSTAVGRRGQHTRDRILGCAAETFLDNGFHGSSIDMIARTANTSRATVYQYFAGKEDIFRELSGAAGREILGHCERLGELGPTMVGIAALHRWVVDLADIYDAHAAAFAEFPGIGTEAATAITGAEDFARATHATLTDRLSSAPLLGLDPHDAAAVLGRIPHMVNLYRHRSVFPLPDRRTTSASLAVALQLMMFPETPDPVLRAVAAREHRGHAKGAMPAPVEPVDTLPTAEWSPTAASSHTASVIVVASSALFAERGYYAVGMDDVAAAAGISRATLYRHFRTKDRILAELTRRAVAEIEDRAATLPLLAKESLTEWMRHYVQFHRVYRGVIRTWFDGTVADLLADAPVEQGIGSVHRSVSSLLETIALPPAVEIQAGAAIFAAVLGRMSEPTDALGRHTDERAAELMTDLLRRSLLRAL